MSFLKTWLDLTEGLITKHLEKSDNTTMGHLQMRRQGLQSTIKKRLDTDLKDKFNTNDFSALHRTEVQRRNENFTPTCVDTFQSHPTKEINTST